MNFEWLLRYTPILWWFGAFSIVTFVGSLLLIPILVIRIPAHYFLYDAHRQQPAQKPPIGMRLLGSIGKNILGMLFVLAGLVMLVIPGQGIITILIGLMLMNFPGKRALERRLVQQPTVLRTLNWMRARAGRPPLVVSAADVTVNTASKTDV